MIDLLETLRQTPDFAALLARYPQETALHRYALGQWQARNYDQAAAALQAALAFTPDDPNLWRDLAFVQQGAGDDPAAAAAIDRAIALDPPHARAWLTRAGLHTREGDHRAAEAAYRTAIGHDQTLADAHLGLGLIQFEQQLLEPAIASFRAAIAHAPGQTLMQACLAHALYAAGDFPGAAAAFADTAEHGLLDDASRHKYAYAKTLSTMIADGPVPALDAYADIAGPAAEDLALVARHAFRLLNLYGHTQAAIRLGQLLLARNPDDPVQRYLMDALSGRPLDRAPSAYVETYFDALAPDFDHRLVDELDYHVPERLTAMVAAQRDTFAAILDLGCGTGLAAPYLARFVAPLTGVDLSARMLDQAGKRGLYADLQKADATIFLQSQRSRFDLVFAADMLIYLGDLEPLFAAAATSLVPGGIFALSIETTEAGPFRLQSSGRFAHDPAYVEALSAQHFEIADRADTVIRLEGRRPVNGRLFALRRR